MTGKYVPLEKFLRALPAKQKEIRLTFARVEGILKFRLPSSAYEDSRWWEAKKEANHVSPRASAAAGWRMAAVSVKAKWVKFVRK